MTSQAAQYKELLRALFKGHTDQARELADQMGDGPFTGTGPLLMAVFGLAVDRRFKNDQSHAAVMTFVQEVSDAFSAAQTPFNPLHAELLVRSALGEDELFQQVPGDQASALMAPLADKIIGDLHMSDEEIDAFLDEAESLLTL